MAARHRRVGLALRQVGREGAGVPGLGRGERLGQSFPAREAEGRRGVREQEQVLHREADILAGRFRTADAAFDAAGRRDRGLVGSGDEPVVDGQDVLPVQGAGAVSSHHAAKRSSSVLVGAGLVVEHGQSALGVVERAVKRHHPDSVREELRVGGTSWVP